MSSSLNSHTPAVTQQHHISNSNQWHVHRKGQQLQERRCCISSWLPAADSSRSAAAEGSTAEESSPLTLHPRSESPEWDTQVRGRPAGRLFQISPTWSWNSSTFSPDWGMPHLQQTRSNRSFLDLVFTFWASLRTNPGSFSETVKYRSTESATSRKNRAGSSSSPRSSHLRNSAKGGTTERLH